MPVAGKHAAPKGEWFWEYSDNDLNQIDDAETIRDHMLRAIFGSFANAKKNPKYAPNRLKWVAYVGGKRESRRLMGDHIYDMHDAVKRRNSRMLWLLRKEKSMDIIKEIERSQGRLSIHGYVSQNRRILLYSFPQLLFQESFQPHDGWALF